MGAARERATQVGVLHGLAQETQDDVARAGGWRALIDLRICAGLTAVVGAAGAVGVGGAGRADGGRGLAREDETMSNIGAETERETLQRVDLGALGVGGIEEGGEWGRGVQCEIVTGICGMVGGGARPVRMRKRGGGLRRMAMMTLMILMMIRIGVQTMRSALMRRPCRRHELSKSQ